ncbi:MAG TPA: PAC2 family protein [Acidimicrobiales bacterium]|nr:PAC2 family protein [Acidimicrobiales bacterium]
MLYELRSEPDLNQPVLVVALEGWIDAGLGAGTAVATLLQQLDTSVVAAFDADELLDHRARRPVMRIENGMNMGLTWPETELRHGQDAAGRDVLMLVGPEPDMRWHAFTSAVTGLAEQLGVRLVVGLGAFPAPSPHTRPVRLASTATDAELAVRVGFVPGALEVPAGIQGALEQAFGSKGIPAIGLWARVPHYVAAMPYPAASAALLQGLADLAGLSLDWSELDSAAALTTNRIDTLIANSAEHTEMVAQLETQQDAAEGTFDLGNLPSGDEIAAELERFLRGER